jgi:signal peptide peptidase SppA
MKYAHVLSFALSHPWAIESEMMPIIASILARHIAGEDVDRAEIEAALVNRKNLPQPRAGSIAIIPMYGVLAPRMNLMSEVSGGTTFEKLTGQLREAVANKDVRTIVFDVDSPGGNVAGATEFAREVMKARTKKPIIAQAQYKMASAAMWAMSGATEIVAAPSAILGALGIITSHNDLSDALAKLGVKRRYLFAGEGKADGNDTEPLSPDAEARLQGQINAAYGQMVGDVVKGRGAGMTADRVRQDWKAHVYGAQEALALGMIDAIATLDDTITRVLSASPDAADQRAALDFTSTTTATLQEPSPATSQEPTSDATWQNGIAAALLSLDM